MEYIIYLCIGSRKTVMDAVMKRKNIDLPKETWQKLSLMAAAQGKSLKAYIEHVLMVKADSITVSVKENPSPTGDTWFDNPENIASVKRGMEDLKAGRVSKMDMNDVKGLLGV